MRSGALSRLFHLFPPAMPSRGGRLYQKLPSDVRDIVDRHLFAEVRAWRRSADYLCELVAGLMQRHAACLAAQRDGCETVEDCVEFLRTSITRTLLSAFVPVTPFERSVAQWVGLRNALRRASVATIAALGSGGPRERNGHKHFKGSYAACMALLT